MVRLYCHDCRRFMFDDELKGVSAGYFYGVGSRASDPTMFVCPYCESNELEELKDWDYNDEDYDFDND